MIVEKQAENATARPGAYSLWCGSTKRIGQLMCGALARQNLTFDERFPHQPELVILEDSEAAVNELGGP